MVRVMGDAPAIAQAVQMASLLGVRCYVVNQTIRQGGAHGYQDEKRVFLGSRFDEHRRFPGQLRTTSQVGARPRDTRPRTYPAGVGAQYDPAATDDAGPQ